MERRTEGKSVYNLSFFPGGGRKRGVVCVPRGVLRLVCVPRVKWRNALTAFLDPFGRREEFTLICLFYSLWTGGGGGTIQMNIHT